MGSRLSNEYSSQEMVQHSPSRNLTPLVFPEDEATSTPRTTSIPAISTSCHILTESFLLSSESIFSFKYDTLNKCSLSITPRITPTEHLNPEKNRQSFELKSGIDQEFIGWALPLKQDLAVPAGKMKELEIKIESQIPVSHSETTLISFKKNGETHGFCIESQILRYKGKNYVLKDFFGINAPDERSECAVCLFNTKDTAILPCNHVCLCAGCGNWLRLQSNKKCPLCRVEAEGLIKLNSQEV